MEEPVAGEPVAGASPAASPRSPRRTRRAGRVAGASQPASAGPAGAASGRSAALRLARLHLRMGQLLLARAQLEALAGRAALDEAALLDLAEVRWRTGDLAGAGEAAGALLARGGNDAIALLIAAESIAAEGRPGEARRLSARALALVEGPLDPIFAGMPRSPIWPEEATSAGEPAASPADRPVRVGRARRVASPVDRESLPASAAAAEVFAGGRAALAGGDVDMAALRLGVALRLDPDFAEGVLDAVGAWEREPALALVAGDALRLLGREVEALAAYDVARGHA